MYLRNSGGKNVKAKKLAGHTYIGPAWHNTICISHTWGATGLADNHFSSWHYYSKCSDLLGFAGFPHHPVRCILKENTGVRPKTTKRPPLGLVCRGKTAHPETNRTCKTMAITVVVLTTTVIFSFPSGLIIYIYIFTYIVASWTNIRMQYRS